MHINNNLNTKETRCLAAKKASNRTELKAIIQNFLLHFLRFPNNQTQHKNWAIDG
jgi:hypothetical protein